MYLCFHNFTSVSDYDVCFQASFVFGFVRAKLAEKLGIHATLMIYMVVKPSLGLVHFGAVLAGEVLLHCFVLRDLVFQTLI